MCLLCIQCILVLVFALGEEGIRWLWNGAESMVKVDLALDFPNCQLGNGPDCDRVARLP